MKSTEKRMHGRKLLSAIFAFAFVLVCTLFVQESGFTSLAQSQGKITASSAKIRKEASASSEVIGSAEKGKSITINNQVQGADGYTWYQTFVNADTLGYIRSDLVEITDGSTPTTVTPVTPSDNGNAAGNAQVSSDNVTVIEPVSATVTSGSAVRVRSSASTGGQILTTASGQDALTVVGTANGSDGKVWYMINMKSNGTDITGFIRSDFVSLSGEIVAKGDNTSETEQPEEETPEPEPTPEPVKKDYDTSLVDGEWYLVDNVKMEQQSIQGLFDMIDNNAKAYETADKKVKSQKVAIIILTLLLVMAIATVVFLFYKIKDRLDSEYIDQVEKDTLRRRENVRAQQRSTRPVGPNQRAPQGRPQGAPQGRPQGAPQGRPQGAPQGRPQGAPQGRPQGAPQGSPQGAPQGAPQGRPQGAPQGRPQGAPQGRPQGAPQGAPQGRPQGAPQGRPQELQKEQPWQSKNFLEDEEDEFRFLNGQDSED